MKSLFSNTNMVARADVSSFTKILLLIFVLAILSWLLGSLVCHFKIKQHKKRKKIVKSWRRRSMIISIISDINLFYSGATLFIMMFLLATIEADVLLKDYVLFILLVVIFANLLSFVVLGLINRRYLKKRKRKELFYKEFLITVGLVTMFSDLLIFFLFPPMFRGITIMLVGSSLFIFLVGILILSLNLQKQLKKNKRNKIKKGKRANR